MIAWPSKCADLLPTLRAKACWCAPFSRWPNVPNPQLFHENNPYSSLLLTRESCFNTLKAPWLPCPIPNAPKVFTIPFVLFSPAVGNGCAPCSYSRPTRSITATSPLRFRPPSASRCTTTTPSCTMTSWTTPMCAAVARPSTSAGTKTPPCSRATPCCSSPIASLRKAASDVRTK